MVIAERTVLNLGEQPCSPFSLYMQSESIDHVHHSGCAMDSKLCKVNKKPEKMPIFAI